MDQILFAVYDRDVRAYRRRAEELHCGLELHIFSEPAVLSGELEPLLRSYKRQLNGFQGQLGLHGAFYDMVSASVDPEIVAVSRKRFRQNLRIAAELGASYVVFHANYMGGLKLANYRAGWHQRQVDFWGAFAGEAEPLGLTLLLENMWAGDPHVIGDVLSDVNRPNFRACFDIAHAALYSERSFAEWLRVLAPFLYCCHLNNHDGLLDQHWPLKRGVIDYMRVLPTLRALSAPPLFTLELPNWESIAASLALFSMDEAVG